MLASSVQAVVACNATVPRVCTLVLFISHSRCRGLIVHCTPSKFTVVCFLSHDCHDFTRGGALCTSSSVLRRRAMHLLVAYKLQCHLIEVNNSGRMYNINMQKAIWLSTKKHSFPLHTRHKGCRAICIWCTGTCMTACTCLSSYTYLSCSYSMWEYDHIQSCMYIPKSKYTSWSIR